MKFIGLQQKIQGRIEKVTQLTSNFNCPKTNRDQSVSLDYNLIARKICSEAFLFNYYLSLTKGLALSEVDQQTKSALIQTIESNLRLLRVLTSNMSLTAEEHLVQAILSDDLELLEASLAAGADINSNNNSKSNYPLNMASHLAYGDFRILFREKCFSRLIPDMFIP